jgi:hypothetical protein
MLHTVSKLNNTHTMGPLFTYLPQREGKVRLCRIRLVYHWTGHGFIKVVS